MNGGSWTGIWWPSSWRWTWSGATGAGRGRRRWRAEDRRIVDVHVVAVVVAGDVVVVDGGVHVAVAVTLGRVEIHAEPEQAGCCERERTGTALAARPRDRRTD